MHSCSSHSGRCTGGWLASGNVAICPSASSSWQTWAGSSATPAPAATARAMPSLLPSVTVCAGCSPCAASHWSATSRVPEPASRCSQRCAGRLTAAACTCAGWANRCSQSSRQCVQVMRSVVCGACTLPSISAISSAPSSSACTMLWVLPPQISKSTCGCCCV